MEQRGGWLLSALPETHGRAAVLEAAASISGRPVEEHQRHTLHAHSPQKSLSQRTGVCTPSSVSESGLTKCHFNM